MTHLSSGQIVDLVDGCADPASAAHAAGCAACRAKVDALVAAIRLAESDAPAEPSPLFWPALSARIGEAVRRQAPPVSPWRSWRWRLAPLGAAAVLVIAVGIGVLVRSGGGGDRDLAPGVTAPAPAPVETLTEHEAENDPSWLLVSVLSAEMSLDDAEASGVLPPPGGADRALSQLDDAERLELARLLREALSAGGQGRRPGPGA